jgi:hypothetical protein
MLPAGALILTGTDRPIAEVRHGDPSASAG